MNLTVSLLTGLLLLLPGMAAVAAWNHGGPDTARRPELQLTSVTTLILLLVISALAHLGGYLSLGVLRGALIDAYDLWGIDLGPVIAPPYEAALTTFQAKVSPAAPPAEVVRGLSEFLAIVVLEAGLVFFLVRNAGLDVLLEPFDLRAQGWVYQHVVRPLRHGFTPIAYVLTNLTADDRGVGYEGVVSEIRQGADGEVKVICLGEPSRFLYELRPAKRGGFLRPGRPEPDVEIYDSEWIGGVLALEASAVQNIIIQLVDESDVEDVAEASETTEAPADAR